MSPQTSKTALCALFALWMATSGMICAPPIEVEPEEPNFPPLISTDYLRPRENPLLIARSTPRVSFNIDQIFDVNANEALMVVWHSPEARNGVGSTLKSEVSAPDPNNLTLHRNVFHRYTGSSFSLNPCDPIWVGSDRFTLSVYVSDGIVTVPQGKPVLLSEGAFLDVYTWSIEFSDSCP